jgi:Flp pilus assembly protein TadD
MAAFQSGHFEEAAVLSRAALENTPRDEGLLTLLAMAEHANGRYEPAAEAFSALTRLRPGTPDYWSNLGLMLRLCGRQADAEAAFQRALAIAPRAYGVLFNYGLLLLDMQRYGAARHRFLDACAVDPAAPDARIYGAIACFECGDTDRAEALIPPRETWRSLEPELHYHLALVLMQLGRAQEAEQLLDPATLGQADTRTLASLAVLQERTNRLEQAQALLDRIRAHPDRDTREVRIDALTVESLLALRRRDYGLARRSTEELLAMGLSPAGEASACFTLGAIADKEGDPAEAMEALARAHAIQLRFAEEIAPEIALSDEEPLRIALPRMTPEQCAFPADPGAPDGDASPVFIVGFPRSGTTMLEQMLDAHPRYVSMDEQPILERCVDQARACGIAYPEELGRLEPAQLARIRGFYREAVDRVVKLSPDQVLVDKNPLNILRLPMIRRLFPAARIILALRHPCDVLLSCYMQDFRSPVFRVLCSSLERLAGSYANTMAFWTHHQALLQANVLTLRYEDTVSDFQAQVERIGRFLGVEDWSHLAGFSEHARRKAYIGTPSYSQVVEPVNARSVARWRHYLPWFAPVLPLLQPAAAQWGYSLAADA